MKFVIIKILNKIDNISMNFVKLSKPYWDPQRPYINLRNFSFIQSPNQLYHLKAFYKIRKNYCKKCKTNV